MVVGANVRKAVVAVLAAAAVGGLLPGLVSAAGAEPAKAAVAGDQTVTLPVLAAGNERFIDALYKDLLGRGSDAGGRGYWVGKLAAGDSRSTVTIKMAGSSEWRRKVVDRLYLKILGRQPSASERSTAMTQLQRGVRVADIAAGLYGSAAFYARSGSSKVGFVDALYQSALGRLATADERISDAPPLTDAKSRVALARKRFLSLEANGLRVDDIYALLLFRSPDAGGRQYWAGQLAKRDDIWMTAAVAAGAEYFNRAQKRVVTGSYTVPGTTKVMSGSTPVSVSGGGTGAGTVVLPAGSTPVVGDVVVVQPGTKTANGLLGKVVSRTVNGSGEVVLTTQHARWDQAFSTMDVKGMIDLPRTPIGVVGADGTSTDTRAVPSCSATLSAGVSITPEASVGADVAFSWGPGKEDVFRFVVRASLGAQVSTTSGGSLGCSLEFPLGYYPVAIGPIALTIEPSIEVGAQLSKSVTTYAAARMTCSVGAETRDGDFENLTGCNPEFEGGLPEGTSPFEAEVSAFAHLKIKTKAYGVVGVYGAIGPELALSAAPCRLPWWTLDVNIDAELGLTAGVWLLDFDWNLAKASIYTDRIAQADDDGCPYDVWTGVTRYTQHSSRWRSLVGGSYDPDNASDEAASGTVEIRYGKVDRTERTQVVRQLFSVATRIEYWEGARVHFTGPSCLVTGSRTTNDTVTVELARPTGGWVDSDLAWIPVTDSCVQPAIWNADAEKTLWAGRDPLENVSLGAEVAGTRNLDRTCTAPSFSCSGFGVDLDTFTVDADLVYRLTALPDKDADGIPDTKDPTPTVFTPL